MQDVSDVRAFRGALGSFATGVTIVTTHADGERDVGLTANSFNSVSLDPPMVLWSLAKTSASLPAFVSAEQFAVHVLAADQEDLSNRFASKGNDKFAGLDLQRNATGVPLLNGCSAIFHCRTIYRYEGGDHVIFVGEVTAFDHSEKQPLVFHGGRYATARHKPAPASSAAEAEIGETSLGRLITRVYLQLVAPLRRNAERLGLSAPERYLMNVLMGKAGQSLDAINDIIGHTGVHVSPEIADGLFRRGLVEEHKSSGDDRRYRLSAEGRCLMVELIAAAKALEADVLGILSDDEQRTLAELLTRMAEDAGANVDERTARHMDLIDTAINRAAQRRP